MQSLTAPRASPPRGWNLWFEPCMNADLDMQAYISLEKCTTLNVQKAQVINIQLNIQRSLPSRLPPVCSLVCNVAISVEQDLKGSPCGTKAAEKTLNYCVCSLV